jgi:Coenzyme PQQ synthesis protein D (PqqD)
MKPKRIPDVETKMLPDGHVVIFSKSSDWAHTITPLAAIAWEYCDGEHSVEQIVERVIEHANAGDSQQLQPAINELLADFAQSGLIADATA